MKNRMMIWLLAALIAVGMAGCHKSDDYVRKSDMANMPTKNDFANLPTAETINNAAGAVMRNTDTRTNELKELIGAACTSHCGGAKHAAAKTGAAPASANNGNGNNPPSGAVNANANTNGSQGTPPPDTENANGNSNARSFKFTFDTSTMPGNPGNPAHVLVDGPVHTIVDNMPASTNNRAPITVTQASEPAPDCKHTPRSKLSNAQYQTCLMERQTVSMEHQTFIAGVNAGANVATSVSQVKCAFFTGCSNVSTAISVVNGSQRGVGNVKHLGVAPAAATATHNSAAAAANLAIQQSIRNAETEVDVLPVPSPQ